MSQARYNILILLPQREPSGVEYHRIIVPFLALVRLYPEFAITYTESFETASDEELKGIQMVVFNRLIPGNAAASLLRLKRLGIVSVIDLDDWWHLSHNHSLREWFKLHRITPRIAECVRMSDHATVTHEYLASKLPKGKSFTVVPNAIDPEIPQFTPRPKPIGDKIEFGWVGGLQHMEDIRLLKESMQRIHSTPLPFTITMCGDSAAVESKYYDKIFSADHTSRPDRYFKIGAEPVNKYAFMYDTFDVSLVPLNHNEFNMCKSNLKLLEAGFKKKAVICSNVHPYSPLLKHNENGIAVSAGDNKNGWYKAMIRYIKTPAMITDHAEALHACVQPYHIEKVTPVRAELFKKLIDDKNK